MKKIQKDMLEALESNYVNVSKASRIVGIDRKTHYLWLDNNPHYKQIYLELRESMIDLAEERLMGNIDGAKEGSIIFFLKTKGKHRGYTEASQITIEDKVITWE